MKKILFILTAMFLFCFSLNAADFSEFEHSEEIMDTRFSIIVYTDNPGKAEKATREAFSKIKEIESELNIYDSRTEISRLNKYKVIESPSMDIKANIEKSLYYAKLSNGAFDITVQPILDLYKKSFSTNRTPPSDRMIKNELNRVDYKRIILKDNKIKIGNNQIITLGGIAKGYAAEKAVEILKKHNIKMALVNAAGNMRAIGKKPNGSWKIALRNPRNNADNFITVIPLDDNAVSTSGDYERYFDENKTFHHIINPKTGYSATELISVTVVADNAFDADAISTSVFVLGKEKGMKLIESIPNVEVLIITRDKKILKSKGFKEVKK